MYKVALLGLTLMATPAMAQEPLNLDLICTGRSEKIDYLVNSESVFCQQDTYASHSPARAERRFSLASSAARKMRRRSR